ncbi:HD domain-containing protein [Streptomyces sp. NPDC056160]|uniref:HD domain-containing protein n=1 Tax=Streptomyces sp. NPDC056160 TaxID=3345731 RepID=UPI0035DD5A25
MTLPGIEEIRALHEKYAPTREAFDLVYTHCEIVWHLSAQLLATAPLEWDGELVRAGALLHDIGVYHLYDADGNLDGGDYIRHGVLGHEILRGEGLPERLGRFCSHHTGVGLTEHDIRSQRLPLPPGDYLAETAEERVVMYADKFHSKSTPPKFLTAPSYARYVARFGAKKVHAFDALRAEFGEPDVTSLAARYGHRVV